MPLTRPRFSQFDTSVLTITDPIQQINFLANRANIDIGWVMNRDGGISSNVAIIWQESSKSFALALTTSTGEPPAANIAVTSYANLIVNSLTANTLSVAGGGLNGVSIGATTPSSGNFTTITVNNSFYANSNTQSISSSTGAIVVPSWGGVGIGGNLNAGSLAIPGVAHTLTGNLRVTNTITSPEAIHSNLTVNSNASTSSTTSGAVVVTGGVGISGNLAVGGAFYANGSIGALGQVLQSTGSGMVWGSAGSTPFTLTSDFGLVTDAATVIEDEGDLATTSTTTYDMGNIAITGPVFPDTLVLPSFSTMPTTVQAGQAVFDTANNAPRFSANATTWNDPVGYTYFLDDISSRFDGIAKAFTLSVNDGSAYSVGNPYQLEIYIGNSPVTPARRYVDYFNLPELAVFNSGYILSTVSDSTRVGNLNIGSGNTIVFSTAPSPSMSFYGKVNTGPVPAFTFKQTPFSAINIMLGP